jgi:hypothetical protein
MSKNVGYIGILLIVAFVSYGCVSFGDTTINNINLPNDWKYRTFIKQTIDWKNNLTDLIGIVLEESKDSNTTLGKIGLQIDSTGDYVYFDETVTILPNDFKPALKMIDDGLVYEFKMDNNLKTELNVSVFAVGLENNNNIDIKRNVVIQDLSYTGISKEDIKKINDKLSEISRKKPNVRKYYVQNATLSVINWKDAVKTDVTVGLKGETYGVKGKVYNTNDTSRTVKDARIHVKLLDIDKYVSYIEKDSKSFDLKKGIPDDLYFIGSLDLKNIKHQQ